MAGEITTLESRLRHLRESLVHVDATLRLFDADADPSKLPAKRPYTRVKLFGAGKLNRPLGAPRRGERPMTTGEVVAAIVAELNYGPEAANGMTNRVRANLRYLRDTRGLVTKEGERRTQGGDWRTPPLRVGNVSAPSALEFRASVLF
jgi:hypothetical protein